MNFPNCSIHTTPMGTHMKVVGLGFGPNMQFLEWFGPKVSSHLECTEANAVMYLTTDGRAYFASTILSGTAPSN